MKGIFESLNNILTPANWTNIYQSHNQLSTGSQEPFPPFPTASGLTERPINRL